ncbi:hypothetical protein ABH920_005329 [Catenulispora sp. EB89]|uniref:hypothetical protein n=1 Tax=Catenulispora sp. EB89 TaxID=3156257 RepID=UPI0035182B3B
MDTWDNAQPDRDQPIGGASALPEESSGGGSGAVPGGASRASGDASANASGAAPEASDAAKPASGPSSSPSPSAQPSDPARQASPDLHYALSLIADEFASAPRNDILPRVMARATRIRRRRRVLRAGSATAVLVVAALLGPSIASELGVRGGDASAAPPPAAIEDLTSAYPMPTALQDDKVMAATPALPANALPWPSRGTPLPAQAVEVAKSYLQDQAGRSAAPGTKAATTATVAPLWSQVDEDTTTAPTTAGHGATAKVVPQPAYKTWLYVMQGWTTGADGVPSQAQLLVGDYTLTERAAGGSASGASGESSSMSVYAAPVTFAHARPGSSDDTDDAQQIAELSVFLPQSNRLVVLGAPQTKTVLYAKTGGDLIPQKTDDGVAVFPRTHRLVKGQYADTIQVRDANNVALTPPKAWSAGDYQLTGAMGLWRSSASGWVTVPAHGGPVVRGTPTPAPTAGTSTAPSAGPWDVGPSSTAPPTQTARPTTAPSALPASGSGASSAASAPVPAPTSSSSGNGSGTPPADPGAAAGVGGGPGFPSSF